MNGASAELADALRLFADGLTVAAILGGFLVTRRRFKAMSLGLGRWWAFRKAHAPAVPLRRQVSRARYLMSAADLTADDEMQWLAGELGDAERPDRALSFTASVPDLGRLARGYELHAARLASRAFLGASTVPALARALALSENTKDYLLHASMLRSHRAEPQGRWSAPAGASGDEREPFRPLTIPHRGVTITPLALPTRRPRTDAFDLIVSYRRHLTAPRLHAPPWQKFREDAAFTELPTSDDEFQRLQHRLANSGEFDSLLPRLVDFRVERDYSSGHRRLHLAVAATSYSSVIVDHYSGADQNLRDTPRGVELPKWHGARSVAVDGRRVGVLTLSLVPVTRCGHLLFAERSALVGTHAGLIGPAVNGNLELLARPFVSVDADRYGVPDPLSALVRESREELGLTIRREAVSALGLIRFDNPAEKGTNVLLATAALDQDVFEVAKGMHFADPIEGRWEVGKQLLAVRIPSNDADVSRIASWLWNSGEFTPHATAAGLAALMASRDCPDWKDIPIDRDASRPRDLVFNVDARYDELRSSPRGGPPPGIARRRRPRRSRPAT